jgi:hypothetical protein
MELYNITTGATTHIQGPHEKKKKKKKYIPLRALDNVMI